MKFNAYGTLEKGQHLDTLHLVEQKYDIEEFKTPKTTLDNLEETATDTLTRSMFWLMVYGGME